ncbi:MAG: zinc ABC transporter substrate-binding protein [Bdellovibrionales bacterium]|nr:zinc ABC transporter substrate-binding protein [Bdellovibrionales bacterium]
MKLRLGYFLTLVLGCVFQIYDPGSVYSQEKPISIVATTGMIADVVQEIAGSHAEVKALMGSGVDPHLYKPTRSDIATLTSADIVFYNGLLLEGKMTDALIRVATSGKKVFAVTELLDAQYLLEPKEFAGLYDPHVWMDPQAWKQASFVIRDKLCEVYPAFTNDFSANANRYQQSIDRLTSYAETVLQSVPKSARVLITSHDAFNYFGRRFGYEVIGIQGMSTESEAGVKDIERIVNLIVARQVKAVFAESTLSDRNVKALIEGAHAQHHAVEIGGRLFSDAMGAPSTYEGTYLGMIDHNVTLIARSLGGKAPVRGMSGNLSVQ